MSYGYNSPRRAEQISEANRRYRYLDIITAFFTAILIASNIASSAKIVDLRLVLFGTPLAFDGGTLLFPLSYIFGDALTEVYGFRAARRVIWTGFGTLALTSLFFFILRILPGEASWEGYAGSAAFNAILGGMSSGGITVASLAGYLAGSLSNAAILSKMKTLTNGRLLWTRTIGSTLAGEFLDTLIFTLAATLAKVFTWSLFPSILLSNYLFKCLVEAAMTPATYLAVATLKKAESLTVTY